MYKIIVGRISPNRQADWYCKDDNPYAVWEGDPLVQVACTGGVWATADELLRERVDIDWGSIAWKASPEEITRFFQVCGLNPADLKRLRENEVYAVVFIETVWGDSA